eukprot:m.6314 g.6314  ORF g.6314 m.6314 type:complete len:286 (-) comp2598_c0_seq1:143-1000(-)
MECPVCLQDCAPAEMASSLGCSCAVCRGCLTRHIEVRVDSGETTIACPCCTSTLHHETIKDSVAPPVFERFARLAAMAEENRRVAADPNLTWCPTPDCETVVTRGAPALQTGTCPRCNLEVCVDCGSASHKRLNCEQARTKTATCSDELAYQKWAKKMTKRCPEASCQAPIERAQIDGAADCNHMICAKCHTEFCWLCGRKVPPIGHFDITNVLGCPGLQYSGPNVDIMTRVGARARALRLRSASGLKTGAKVSAVGIACIVATPFVLVAMIPYGGYVGIRRLRR